MHVCGMLFGLHFNKESQVSLRKLCFRIDCMTAAHAQMSGSGAPKSVIGRAT